MKKSIVSILIMVFLLSLTACSENKTATVNSNSNQDSTANSQEDIDEAEEMLSTTYSDFIGYYRVLFKKANAATDDAFKNYDTSEIKLRDRSTDEIRKYFMSGWNIATADDGSDEDEKLFALCSKVNTLYENVSDLKDSSYRNNVINLCNNLYEYLQSLADYLGEVLPSYIVKVDTTTPNASATAKNTSSAKITATTSSKSASPTSSSKASTSATISNSRWNGKKASSASNGYSIIFKNGKAYLGTTLESDSTIISSGHQCTYEVKNGKIYFKSIGDSRTATMTYDGSKIVESSVKSQTIFEQNYILKWSHNLP